MSMENPAPSAGRLVPPLWLRLIGALALILALVARGPGVTGDQAANNVVILLCLLATGGSLGVWFLFFSGYSRRGRAWTFTLGFCALVLFFMAFRIEHVSGELVPTFRLRWAKHVDETLEKVVTTGGTAVDLRTTTKDDFPQFLGPSRNGRIEHVQLARDWTQPPQRLWRQPIGAGWAAFAAVNGHAVTLEQRGAEELVTCYEIATGKLAWSHSTTARHETTLGGIGPRSTPTIANGRVFTQGATGEVLCLDGADGRLIWRVNLLEKYHVAPGTDEQAIAWGRSGSPLAVDDLVVVPAGGPRQGPWVSLVAFHQETGKVAWEVGTDQVSYCSPTLVTLCGIRQIACVNEKSVTGHDPATGRELWNVEWPGNSTQNANVSQPVLVDDTRLLLSKAYWQGSALYQFAPGEGGVLTASRLWEERTLLKTKFTNVVLHGGHAYGLSDGTLECVHLDSGKRKWKRGRYGQGQILGVGDVILVQAESGEVVMVSANPSEFSELGRFAAIEGRTWNNLCLAGKRLLVRNAEEAACYLLP